jgi:hypothetical protein
MGVSIFAFYFDLVYHFSLQSSFGIEYPERPNSKIQLSKPLCVLFLSQNV